MDRLPAVNASYLRSALAHLWFVTIQLTRRSLSSQESRVVLALAELHRREATRADIVRVLGGSRKAADHVIESLRHKGWLERAAWGKYLLVPPDQGPDAIGDSNLLALASRITDQVPTSVSAPPRRITP